MTDSRDTHTVTAVTRRARPAGTRVMSRRRDGRGRRAHLVCRIRVRQRAEADT